MKNEHGSIPIKKTNQRVVISDSVAHRIKCSLVADFIGDGVQVGSVVSEVHLLIPLRVLLMILEAGLFVVV